MKNRTKQSKQLAGRIYVCLPVSLSPETVEWVNDRVSALELEAVVANRSDYFKKLIQADKQGLIQTLPKEESQLLMAGIAA